MDNNGVTTTKSVKQTERDEAGSSLADPDRWSVVSAPGAGCWELGQVLAGGDLHTVHRRNLRDACITAGADLLVQPRLTSFDLVSVVVPHGFHQETVGSVVAAVGGGPHSLLAARVARKIADVIGVKAAMITVARSQNDVDASQQVLDQIGDRVPGLTPSVVRARSAEALVEMLELDTLLVIGAPGGSWVQRQLLGPGQKLRHAAPGGVIVVRSAEPRCFQKTTTAPGLVVSPWLRVEDARWVIGDAPVAPVVADGFLVGIVRQDALRSAPADVNVATVAEEAVFVLIDDPLDAAADLHQFLEGAPVPVVDRSMRWLGSLSQ
jgi:hypothetical protein